MDAIHTCMKTLNKQVGVITKVTNYQSIDTYTLDSGYTWSGSKGTFVKGDMVSVQDYLMGTVTVSKLGHMDADALEDFTKGAQS